MKLNRAAPQKMYPMSDSQPTPSRRCQQATTVSSITPNTKNTIVCVLFSRPNSETSTCPITTNSHTSAQAQTIPIRHSMVTPLIPSAISLNRQQEDAPIPAIKRVERTRLQAMELWQTQMNAAWRRLLTAQRVQICWVQLSARVAEKASAPMMTMMVSSRKNRSSSQGRTGMVYLEEA